MSALEQNDEPWRPMDSFGNRLRLLRAECGLNAEQLAAACGVTHAAFYAWENGASPRDKAAIVIRLCEATGCDREWLMWGGPLWPLSSSCLQDTCWSEALPLQFDFGLQMNEGHMLGAPFDPFRHALAS